MEKRKSLIFFLEWMRVLRKYDRLLRWAVVEAICDYQEKGEVPDFRTYFKKKEVDKLGEEFFATAETAFAFIKEDIDRNNAKYEAICTRRREWAKKGVEARNRKAIEKEKSEKTTKTTLSYHKVPYATYNDNDNDNVNDNDNGNDNDIINNDNNINNNITTTTKNKKKVFEIFLKDENKSISEKEFLNEIKGGGGEGLYDEFGGQAAVEKLFHQIMRDWEKRGAGEHESYVNALCHLTSQMRIQNNINNRKAKKNGNTKSKSKAVAAEGRGDNRAEHVDGTLPQGGYAQSGKELEF